MSETMRTNQLVIVAFWSLSLGALAGGCTAESVPNVPTYEEDVKPILESRCIRCHGAGGTLNADPEHTGTVPGGAPFNGYFTQLEDGCPSDAGTGMCYGLLHYTGPVEADGGGGPSQVFRGYIHSTSDSASNARMPPPPSPLLTSRQIDILDKWLSNPVHQ